VDRTNHLDSLANLVRDGLITFHNYGQQKEVIKSHLRDMVREKMGEKTPVWRKLTGHDHYFHSLAYLSTSVKFYRGEFVGHKTEEARTVLAYGAINLGGQSRANLWGHQSRAY